ncbi:class I mannose-6-phosphate isomerase [Fulvivirgaceae bacterium BMA12]|uniref:Class I mannose-6-phosphate isomerase n=1 Tax=Agaribacillus aureus TaxID=3051825 RepID=A0ABT8LK43_9BACT|nr:class I mannose-6-phosphate isomerase [Fulvivirgaceae bacterium BMA12]
MTISNYDKFPSVKVSDHSEDCVTGWENIGGTIRNRIAALTKKKVVIVIDCYHGVNHTEVEKAFRESIEHIAFYNTTELFKTDREISEMVYPFVTDDEVFGYWTTLRMGDYFDPGKLQNFSQNLKNIEEGVVIIYGAGAACLAEGDLLVYCDMARWEIQLRMRRNEVSNLGLNNRETDFSLQYKHAYFVDWRVLDQHKTNYMTQWNYVVDTNCAGQPKMIKGADLLKGLKIAAHRPFRVVPFFDPGPWGGQWLKKVADLDKDTVNFAWAFDCVPEENSMLLRFGETTFEIPSVNLVFNQPEALLGKKVYERFGAEFPIRFDLLDTMEGGNLSLQVHPTVKYIKEKFGMNYTQDESYYLLDAKENAVVYLGLNEDVDPDEMIHELEEAQKGMSGFDADKHVKKWPVKKHDHVLIPAGTVHCSGKDSIVLEISTTPYIFTFKLWDWGRLGLDGKPRPINIKHGQHVIQWDRKESWIRKNLLNDIEKVAEGDGWIEEKTGLHAYQFLESRRHWFTKPVLHTTDGGVNVINLVEGKEAIVESPEGLFEPFVIHYAETFIVPAAVGEYTIRPYGASEGQQCATLKAFVQIGRIKNSHHYLAD